jgi:predicted nucleotidyltransferase
MASSFLDILSRLHDRQVEFVIVGGVAAALHGVSRVTFDLDVVPNLAPESWRAAVDLLWSLGARPRIPEPIERLRDLEQIRRWQRDKGMLALNLRTPDGGIDVDLLVSESPRFDALRQRATPVTLDGRTFLVASIDDLIAMKRAAGRPQDVLDITQLEDIKKRLER